MKKIEAASITFWIAGILCLLGSILTGWNEKAFLPLALTFIMAAIYSGIACEKLQQGNAAES
ncbi:MAG: hypothetical protein ACI4SU_02905 [Anaerovoracaceae bacterium]